MQFDPENPTLGWSIAIILAIFLIYFGGISLLSQLIFRYRESRGWVIFWLIATLFFVVAFVMS